MKRSELYYREPQNESYAPRHRTDQPKPSGSLNNETEKRIVMLYTSGHSVEAITREVGRARHRVVHLLQTRGLFGGSQKESICQEPGKESPATGESEPKPRAVEESSEAPNLPAKSDSPPQLKLMATEEPKATHPAVEKLQTTSRWSPMVVDGLCRVIMQLNLYPGMSPGEVQEQVSEWNRQEGS